MELVALGLVALGLVALLSGHLLVPPACLAVPVSTVAVVGALSEWEEPA